VALALLVAAGGTFLLAGGAGAAPLALGKSAAVQSSADAGDVILVRDGCGRGLRWSNSRQRCVVADVGGPPGVVVAPGVVVTSPVVVPRGRVCGYGLRWSNGLGRCVPL
jgi:hypothetical protein